MAGKLVVSPCSNPELGLEEVLRHYSDIGYQQMELFTSWAKSAVDVKEGPERIVRLSEQYRMKFTSLHLPVIHTNDEAAIRDAVAAARFAETIGAEVVIFKASSKEIYMESAKSFLDQIEGLSVVPVLQNTSHSAIRNLEDFSEVLDGIRDNRMKTLLEVGHFHSVGVSWKEGLELLGSSVALVHIKDQIGEQSVPFGMGEIDLPGLFKKMDERGYGGKYVIEMEVSDTENTLIYLKQALDYCKQYLK